MFVVVVLLVGCSGGAGTSINTGNQLAWYRCDHCRLGFGLCTSTIRRSDDHDCADPARRCSPAATTGGDHRHHSAEQAASLDQSVGATTDPIGGWLAVYDSLGIPVLGAGGVGIGTTGDDPIGPTFDAVWMMSDAGIKGSGLPLSDVVRMYVDNDAQSAGLANRCWPTYAGVGQPRPAIGIVRRVCGSAAPHRALAAISPIQPSLPTTCMSTWQPHN